MPVRFFRVPVGLFALVYLLFNVVLAFFAQGGPITYPSHVIAFGRGFAIAALGRRGRLRAGPLATLPGSGAGETQSTP